MVRIREGVSDLKVEEAGYGFERLRRRRAEFEQPGLHSETLSQITMKMGG